MALDSWSIILWSLAVATTVVVFGFSGSQWVIAIKRDLNAAKMLVTMKCMYAWLSYKGMNVPRLWEQNVRQNKSKIALIEAHTGRKFTFDEIDDLANRTSWVLRKNGVEHGDTVAIMLPNSMEYVASWLGTVKLGCVAALMNTMFVGPSLRHAFRICKAKAVIIHEQFLPALAEIYDELDTSIVIFAYTGDKTNMQWVDMCKETRLSNNRNPSDYNKLTLNSPTLMLFTSGTTGNNKVVRISGFKTHFMGWSLFNLCGWGRELVFYTSLPLFHGNAGGMCLGQMLWNGCTVVIRDKFSASKFWVDVRTHKANVINYIGEIGSYLLAQPESNLDKDHYVNFAVGNGLTAEVWRRIQTRFKIDKIVEFYASTEGNCNLVNSDGYFGACGFLPGGLARLFFPVNLIKCDEKTMEPVRGNNGLCQLCKPGETGQIVGKIRNDYLSRFEGYSDGDASRRKIIKDVFNKGDSAFISGDLLRIDEYGWCYFVQRVADCYRVKGENISTAMIEEHMQQLLNYKYMITSTFTEHDQATHGLLVVKGKPEDLGLIDFEEALKKLPKFSRPSFVRFTDDLPMTPTMKVQKHLLRRRGLNPYKTDQLFTFHDKDLKLTPSCPAIPKS